MNDLPQNSLVKEAASPWKTLVGALKNPYVSAPLAGGPLLTALDYGKIPGTENFLMRGVQDKIQNPTKSEYALATVLNTLGLLGMARGFSTGNLNMASLSGLGTAASTPALYTLDDYLKGLQSSSELDRQKVRESKALTALGLGGLGLLGVLGYKGLKGQQEQRKLFEEKMEQDREAQTIRDAGKVKITLPTSDPYDQETVVELPLDDARLTQSSIKKLRRDLRNRLREESKERTKKKDPTTGNLISMQGYQEKYGTSKVASLLHDFNTLLALKGNNNG